MICDNLSARKAPAVHRWLLAHPRFVLHFTPTYSSWINQVERWLAESQRRCLERGVFCSLDALTTALEEWIKLWNENAQPFKWTKTADQIIDRIAATAHASPDRDTWLPVSLSVTVGQGAGAPSSRTLPYPGDPGPRRSAPP